MVLSDKDGLGLLGSVCALTGVCSVGALDTSVVESGMLSDVDRLPSVLVVTVLFDWAGIMDLRGSLVGILGSVLLLRLSLTGSF